MTQDKSTQGQQEKQIRSEPRDGGLAFPRAYSEITLSDGHQVGFEPQDGMSLRDYFAARALPWCLSEFGGNADDQKQPVEAAYQIADLALAERSKRHG